VGDPDGCRYGSASKPAVRKSASRAIARSILSRRMVGDDLVGRITR
jgi:hypothetical protein